MSQSDSLRNRSNQHKPKNNVSKQEDKAVAAAADRVIDYIESRFASVLADNVDNVNHTYFDLTYEDSITIGDIVRFITRKGHRKWEDFDHSFDNKKLQPDGGIIYLRKIKEEETEESGEHKTVILEKYPLVIAEVKHQGSNDKLVAEGKQMQAFGNAIERLGKNLEGIRAMMHYEGITPFICFGDGCDFAKSDEIDDIVKQFDNIPSSQITKIKNKFIGGTNTVRAKAFTLNDFYKLNTVFIFKKDKSLDDGSFSPVSMMFRYKPWTEDEMFEYMKEIAETSFRYYMF